MVTPDPVAKVTTPTPFCSTVMELPTGKATSVEGGKVRVIADPLFASMYLEAWSRLRIEEEVTSTIGESTFAVSVLPTVNEVADTDPVTSKEPEIIADPV
jgi:hypothetical protein